eukprot:GHVP01015448.1.p3 GENE.GHVP01015448.1~~GHVP01015448.1.p3  ORF type:complete len:101 (-),score=16.80 GHVP01015448.1:485-787(-)
MTFKNGEHEICKIKIPNREWKLEQAKIDFEGKKDVILSHKDLCYLRDKSENLKVENILFPLLNFTGKDLKTHKNESYNVSDNNKVIKNESYNVSDNNKVV